MHTNSGSNLIEMIKPGLEQFVRSDHRSPAYDKEFFKNGKIG
jgi:hypothetical protein